MRGACRGDRSGHAAVRRGGAAYAELGPDVDDVRAALRTA